jgi:chromosome partitioning protein
MMRAIVLATQKGGSGKSTLAIGLAAAAMENGQRVCIVEADQQGTVSSWRRRRAVPEPRIERAGSAMEIERALQTLRNGGFTLALIDTPATSNDLTGRAIAAADMCLIPARPSPADIEAALPTLDTVRSLGKPFAFVLNQAPARGYRPEEGAAALSAAGMLALPYIVQRNDHQDALGAGFTVIEFAPTGRAAQEIRSLWQWVWQKMTGEAFDHGRTPIRAVG